MLACGVSCSCLVLEEPQEILVGTLWNGPYTRIYVILIALLSHLERRGTVWNALERG